MFLVVFPLLIGFLWITYFLMPATSKGLPILTYDGISSREEDRLTISTLQLNEHLELIHRLGYTPISFTDLNAFIYLGQPLPERPVLLTLFGGYESVCCLAYPLLEKYQFKATIFVSTATIGLEESERTVDYKTISSMSSELIEVGLYSPRIDDSSSTARIEADLEQSIAALSASGCRVGQVFAYSPTAMHADQRMEKATRRIFQKSGIDFVLRTGSGINKFPLRDVYGLRRIEVCGSDSPREFKSKLMKGRSWTSMMKPLRTSPSHSKPRLAITSGGPDRSPCIDSTATDAAVNLDCEIKMIG